MQQPAKPAHEQLTQYRDQLANDLLRVEQSVSLLSAPTHAPDLLTSTNIKLHTTLPPPALQPCGVLHTAVINL
jgi:hypothetical protein